LFSKVMLRSSEQLLIIVFCLGLVLRQGTVRKKAGATRSNQNIVW
jgi:hypothetical protein